MVRLVLLALLGLCACDRAKPRRGIPPRHALLVTIDGLRADRCSVYLYRRDTTTFPLTPEAYEAGRNLTLDELAHDGVLFTQAFAPTGHPRDSLAALHTGRSADPRHAPGQAVELDGAATLAEGFHAAGLLTVAFVTGDGPLPEVLARGFDQVEVGTSDLDTVRNAVEYCSDRDWADGRGQFLWMHLTGPAAPYWPAPPEGVDLGKDFTTQFADPAYEGERDGRVLQARLDAGEVLTPEELAHLGDLYDGELALTNFLLYQFLDFLRYGSVTAGAWDATVAVVAGTGGAELGARAGRAPWEVLRDSGLRVPLLLRHPDSLTGRRIFADLVTLSDVAPTLARWFELDVELEGRSLLGITDSDGQPPFLRRPVVASDGFGRATLRTDVWRLVTNGDGSAALHRIERMQELEEDFADVRPEVVRTLRAELEAALAEGSE